MKILQVHKFFYHHAGAEAAFFNTVELLERRGHRVIHFAMSDARNESSQYSRYFAAPRSYQSGTFVERARDSIATIYSKEAKARMRELLVDEQPDVAHLHLISHQLTFSIVDVLREFDIPIVMTLHDYKIGCPAYMAYRDGQTCLDCAGNVPTGVVKYRCHKGSLGASGVAFLEAWRNQKKGAWHKIDGYIAPSEFAAGVAVAAGISKSRVNVLQNFIPVGEVDWISQQATVPPLSGKASFFYAGRLEDVKGLKWLIDVFGSSEAPGLLRIAGAGGALLPAVEAAARGSSNISFLGRLSRSDVMREMAASRAVVVPSLWDENNPISLLEARAAGAPVVATRVGGLPEMVTDRLDGYLVQPHDTPELLRVLRQLADNASMAKAMGLAGRKRLEEFNGENAHYRALINIYTQAVESK